ncbi:MAG: co-chaperone GroES [Patescibacteria group bacterium]
MTLKPLHNQVIIKGVPFQEKTIGGLVLPGTADKERPEKGEVIAVGPGRLLENGSRAVMSVSVGQQVVFKKYAPDEIKIDGEDFFVIREEDIIAIVE